MPAPDQAWHTTGILFVPAVVVAFCAAGCGGGGSVNLDVRKPAAERPDIGGAASAGGRFLIPAEVAFNISSFTSGQTGAARGAADPTGSNGAVCRAEARDGGSAWGEMQLGYCLDNAAGRPLQALVKLKARVSGAITTDGAPSAQGGRLTTANTLVFLIKDTYGLVLKQERLYAQDPEKGAAAATAPHDLVFDVRLEPDRGYYFFLSGRSEAQSAAGQSIASTLETTDYQLDLSWHEAPATGAAPVSAPSPASSPTGAGDPVEAP